MRILALEPYYGGSHRRVLDGLLERLDCEADLLTMPARKWKWRMRGAAISMAEQVRELDSRWHGDVRNVGTERDKRPSSERWDLVFASTFVNLAELYGLAGRALATVPSVVYFHENQLVYPNRHEADWDYQFPLTNITSAMSADLCLFNSKWTMRTFLDEIPGFIARFPDRRPGGIAEKITSHSRVIAPPFDPAPFDEIVGRRALRAERGDRLRIVWPHRWEHDKDPDTFFDVVCDLAREGLDFEVAVAGQAFQDVPRCFQRAADQLGDRLVHVGEPETREAYASLLARCDVAVSTALNEFFGLAMIEACYAGCFPLVPDRLAYQDLYPSAMRYSSADELRARLRAFVAARPAVGRGRALAEEFTFDALVPKYAEVFAEVAGAARR